MSAHCLITELSSSVTPPAEPPVFEITPEVSLMENEEIIVQIAGTLAGTNSTDGLEIFVENVPENATFSAGTRNGSRWVFTPEDFGDVELNLPEDFTGRFDLEITAVTVGASRQRNLVINIEPNSTTTAEPPFTPTTAEPLFTPTSESSVTDDTTGERPTTEEYPTSNETAGTQGTSVTIERPTTEERVVLSTENETAGTRSEVTTPTVEVTDKGGMYWGRAHSSKSGLFVNMAVTGRKTSMACM